MYERLTKLAGFTAFAVAFSGGAQAEEVDIASVIDSAMPHMHHSCASVLETYADDDEAVAKIVREMAFVSIYNRQLDILALVPDATDQETLRGEFIEELEDACDDDPGRLLAGAVDDAVRVTMEPYD
jgi:hypothetical protein